VAAQGSTVERLLLSCTVEKFQGGVGATGAVLHIVLHKYYRGSTLLTWLAEYRQKSPGPESGKEGSWQWKLKRDH
jgi:hypothetical protein